MNIIKTSTLYIYALRIDELNNGGDKIKLLSLFNHLTTLDQKIRSIISQEVSKEVKKVHYHAYIEIPMKIKELRNKIDYVFKEHKRSTKSLAICKKPDNYLAYLTKDADVIFSSGYTEEQISQLKKWEVRREFKQNMVELLHAHVGLKKNMDDIVDAVLEWHDTNNKQFDKFRLRAYCWALYYKNNKKDKNIRIEIRQYIMS